MIIALQHVPWEPMGLIEQILADHGLPWHYTRPYAGDPLPRNLDDVEGLVIMGGPMSVYEQNLYPYLREETALIEKALSSDLPLLGICLGSQLLALTLGARVSPAQSKEIGWFPVRRLAAGRSAPLLEGIPDEFTAFHWHGDCYDLPVDSRALLSSDQTPVQAFQYGESAFGLLLHLEVTAEIIGMMVDRSRAELEKAGVKDRPILEGRANHLAPLNKIGSTVFGKWTDLVAERQQQKEQIGVSFQ